MPGDPARCMSQSIHASVSAAGASPSVVRARQACAKRSVASATSAAESGGSAMPCGHPGDAGFGDVEAVLPGGLRGDLLAMRGMETAA